MARWHEPAHSGCLRAQDLQKGILLMSTNGQPWDVAMALRDVSAAIAGHVHNATIPTPSELNSWLHYINKAAPVYWALESACEALIEDGVAEARVQALKDALTYAQGQIAYWPRRDRW